MSFPANHLEWYYIMSSPSRATWHGTNLCLCNPQPDISLCCEIMNMDGASVSHGVPFMSQLLPVQSYAA